MPNATPLRINVLDENKKDIHILKLAVIPSGKPESVLRYPYDYSLEKEQAFFLIVEETGMAPYRFPLESKVDGSGFTVKFQEVAVSPAHMVKISRITPSDPLKAGVISLQINLSKANEIVLVSGWDYSGGTKNRIFPITRMRDLYADNRIDNATLITMYEFETGMKTQWVRGSDKIEIRNNSIKKGWCLLRNELQGSTAPDLKVIGSPGHDCISITHVYDYIIDIGKKRPGTLTEFSVFSHSWWGGPILLDTGERPEFRPGGTNENQRDPHDKDCRWKDFNSTNMPDIKAFKAAFNANCVIKLWGCLAITAYNRMIYKARKAASDTQVLNIPREDRISTRTGTVFPDTKPGVDDYLKDSAFKDNYMNVMTKAIGIPVWGGGPGMGANYLQSSPWHWMYIAEYVLSVSGGKRVKGAEFYKGNMDYLRTNHSKTFDTDGYMKYE